MLKTGMVLGRSLPSQKSKVAVVKLREDRGVEGGGLV
jgi:hypothetical protein